MIDLKNNIEILAPCGSYESVEAAVRQGADAVYIGALRFSARAYASNFDESDLKKTIEYCHLHKTAVHLAVNTLVSDEELLQALGVVKKAYELGADAFIVQDLGLAYHIKRICPQAVLHASTQMGVHTPQAARLLYSMGFDRVVLAREMSKDEIEAVVRSCDVETEVFVHGALCMCMSGQCYLSAMLGGRSGNRGRCAQPCRLPFSVVGGTGHDLSLKDNCIIDKISELAEMGVTSAKIEGRMKRPEYVAAAVAACKKAKSTGNADKSDLDRLRAVFSRSGFTDGYYNGKLGKEMFGTRSKEDVVSATNKVLSELRMMYKDEIQSRLVDMKLTLRENVPTELTAVCGDLSVTVKGEVPQTARTVALSEQKAAAQLSKTGGTAFRVQSASINVGDNLTVPISQLNAMRREVLDKLERQITTAEKKITNPTNIFPVLPHRREGKLKYRAHFRNCDIPDIFQKCEFVYVPLFSSVERIDSLIEDGFTVAVEIPRAIFGLEEKVAEALEKIRQVGVLDVYCGNIGTVALAKKLGFTVHGGFALNIFNTSAVNFYEELGLCDTELSCELTANQINSMGGSIERGFVGYGHLPLMITRNCPNKNGKGCSDCKGKSVITDRRGKTFTLMCSSGCTELLNGNALVLSDKQGAFKGADFMSFRFTYESKEECENIFKDYLNRKKPTGEYTGGLYFRGVE